MKRVTSSDLAVKEAKRIKRAIKLDLIFEKISLVSGIAILLLSALYAYYIYNAPSSSMIGITDLLVIFLLAFGGYLLIRSAKAYKIDADRNLEKYTSLTL